MDTTDNIQVLQNRVDELNQEAWQCRVNDSLKSHTLSKEAVAIAESINYANGKAKGYQTLGFSYIRLSKHDEAVNCLEKSLILHKELGDLEGQGGVYECFGIIQRSLGNLSSSLEFLFKGFELIKQTHNREGEALAQYHIGVTYKYLGNYEIALEYLLQSLSIAKDINSWIVQSYSVNLIGQIYFETGNFNLALEYYHDSLSMRQKSGDKWGEAGCLDNIGFTHFKINDYRQAVNFCEQSLIISESTGDKKGQGNVLYHLGAINKQTKDYQKSEEYIRKSLMIRSSIGDKKGEAEVMLLLAELLLDDPANQDYDQILLILNKVLILGEEVKALDLLSRIHHVYYQTYKQYKQFDDALRHLEIFIDVEKQLHKDVLAQKIQNLEIAHRAEQSKNEAEIYRLKNIELVEQKKIAEQSLFDLKAAQQQLIQTEKMASLGELTAGIAHEIQNPLNFVNNFSEVNKELLAELKQEIDNGNFDEAKALTGGIISNQEKINHHGRRADAIVKNMLQHSRSSEGVKELIDINALADEFLKLAYHGLRAKDSGFNATLKTDYDEQIEKINIIPQDVGRVILNLINNAFYAVTQKKKQLGDEYEAIVTVSTKKISGKVEIIVSDNGTGIPQKVLDKIYQPFFTTKPAGQGTGLGLSLTYDIVKAHGGEIKVETRQGEGTVFNISLPV